MLRQDRQVEFTLCVAPLDQNLCARLLASLQPDYEGFELKIKNLFGYAMLDARFAHPAGGHEAGRCAHQRLSGQEQHYHHGQNITVGVCHGTKFLQEMGFEELLAKRVAEHTGVTPNG